MDSMSAQTTRRPMVRGDSKGGGPLGDIDISGYKVRNGHYLLFFSLSREAGLTLHSMMLLYGT